MPLDRCVISLRKEASMQKDAENGAMVFFGIFALRAVI